MLSASGLVYEEIREDAGDGGNARDGAGGKKRKIVIVDISDSLDSGLFVVARKAKLLTIGEAAKIMQTVVKEKNSINKNNK